MIAHDGGASAGLVGLQRMSQTLSSNHQFQLLSSSDPSPELIFCL